MVSELQHDETIRHLLARWRMEAGITQAAMGELLNVSRRSIQMIEGGESKVKLYTLIQWAEYTGHDPIVGLSEVLSTEDKKEAFIESLEQCPEKELGVLIEIKKAIDVLM